MYKSNAKYLGMEYPPTDHTQYISTDMGNVSYEVPSIHPHFYCGTDSVNHTREFTAAVGAYNILTLRGWSSRCKGLGPQNVRLCWKALEVPI